MPGVYGDNVCTDCCVIVVTAATACCVQQYTLLRLLFTPNSTTYRT